MGEGANASQALIMDGEEDRHHGHVVAWITAASWFLQCQVDDDFPAERIRA